MKRDWYVYGEDKCGRRRNLAGGGFVDVTYHDTMEALDAHWDKIGLYGLYG